MIDSLYIVWLSIAHMDGRPVCPCISPYDYITFGPSCWNQGSIWERLSQDRVLELHNNGEPVYCTTHRIRELYTK